MMAQTMHNDIQSDGDNARMIWPYLLDELCCPSFLSNSLQQSGGSLPSQFFRQDKTTRPGFVQGVLHQVAEAPTFALFARNLGVSLADRQSAVRQLAAFAQEFLGVLEEGVVVLAYGGGDGSETPIASTDLRVLLLDPESRKKLTWVPLDAHYIPRSKKRFLDSRKFIPLGSGTTLRQKQDNHSKGFQKAVVFSITESNSTVAFNALTQLQHNVLVHGFHILAELEKNKPFKKSFFRAKLSQHSLRDYITSAADTALSPESFSARTHQQWASPRRSKSSSKETRSKSSSKEATVGHSASRGPNEGCGAGAGAGAAGVPPGERRRKFLQGLDPILTETGPADVDTPAPRPATARPAAAARPAPGTPAPAEHPATARPASARGGRLAAFFPQRDPAAAARGEAEGGPATGLLARDPPAWLKRVGSRLTPRAGAAPRVEAAARQGSGRWKLKLALQPSATPQTPACGSGGSREGGGRMGGSRMGTSRGGGGLRKKFFPQRELTESGRARDTSEPVGLLSKSTPALLTPAGLRGMFFGGEGMDASKSPHG